MGLGSVFSKWFGGGQDTPAAVEEATEYEGYRIVPAPIAEGGQYRTAGTIEKTLDGTLRSTRFIRADNHGDRQVAIDHSLQKARQIIDEQGLSLFDREIA